MLSLLSGTAHLAALYQPHKHQRGLMCHSSSQANILSFPVARTRLGSLKGVEGSRVAGDELPYAGASGVGVGG